MVHKLSLSFIGPQTWAIVPEDIKYATSLTEFKTKIKNWEPKGANADCVKYTYNIWVSFSNYNKLF